MKVREIRVLAVLEILEGIIGAYNFLSDMAGSWRPFGQTITFFLFIVALGLFLLSVVAGVLLWNGSRVGVPLSLAAQIPQVIQYSAGGLTYMFFAGAAALVGISSEGAEAHLNLALNLRGNFAFTWGPDAVSFSANVDIYAVAFILALLRHRRQA